MLKLEKLVKKYHLFDHSTTALDSVSIEFRKNEFVAILGPSGCGKTTLLNMIGGLDRYDSGNIIINGVSTKEYKASDWDDYRNKRIGFVFQSYNLIPHLSILGNVELALSLSGVSKKERNNRARKALEEVGLKKEINKKPNQLSGGQMQRVAIARALVNNPEILLADEPTGALDSKTSVEVMELIKKIAEDRLVIMVTHNADLANQYATRIVNLLDGKIISDSNEYKSKEDLKVERKKNKKSSMSFFTALNLSLRNLFTKKGRTALTALAGSIGIAGILLVLAISNGLNGYIANMEASTLGGYPIAISTIAVDYESVSGAFGGDNSLVEDSEETDSLSVYDQQNIFAKLGKYNFLGSSFISYVDDFYQKDLAKTEDKRMLSSMEISYASDIKVLTKDIKDKVVKVDTKVTMSSIYGTETSTFFKELNNKDFVMNSYEVVEGHYPENKNEILLVIGASNNVSSAMLDKLGIIYEKDGEEIKPLKYSEIVGKEYRVVKNDDFYIHSTENGVTSFSHLEESKYNDAYDNVTNDFKLTISGILKEKDDAISSLYSTGIMYTDAFAEFYRSDSKESLITKKTKEDKILYEPFVVEVEELESFIGSGTFKFYDPVSMQAFVKKYFNMELTTEEILEVALQAIGASDIPTAVYMYAANFEAKDQIKSHIDAWNNDPLNANNQITFSDVTSILSNSLGKLINIVSYVLIAFAAISLLVSSIMIGVITYVSVVERTKEIGILRAIGARALDISRVFNSETFILGALSGILATVLSLIVITIANGIIKGSVNLILSLGIPQIIFMILISVVLTLLSGLIPALIATKKDPVVALRTE